ncbi:MAG: anti-sigma F factor antagonist [Emergencia sp.]|nr:anti-sigma F factor antagonist [Emergencia sp.]
MDTMFYLKEDTLVVCLSGEIDHHVAERLRNDIDAQIQTYAAKNLILDFSDVSFMDSSGIGVVLGRYKKLAAVGGTVMIQNADRLIRQILDMSGIFSLMPYRETKDKEEEETWKVIM